MLTPIAIIGIGCRFPGADNPVDFWNMLREGRSAITEVPNDRWAPDSLPKTADKPPGKWGGFINNIDQFDADFFGISSEEAAAMDPQQRLMLEAAWTCLEDAAIIPQSLAGSNTGVFVGISSLNYGSVALQRLANINRFTNTGSGAGTVANRISYFLDLHGPSFAVDAACASSLLAVHLACQSIWQGDCAMALAGGVNAILLPGGTIGLSASSMLSPDERCRVFDAGASGTVRGEGAGLVLLKSLPSALAAGDPIYATIRSSALSQNGKSNGISGPNRLAQESVLREAYRRGELEPAHVQYVEAHSTATLIGDATELAAVGAVMNHGRPPTANSCAIGSVKANIGHLEAAAGIAGLIKTSLMLKHQTVVPTLHFERPNPHAKLDSLRLRVLTEPAHPWPAQQGGRLAGVSAAGNAGCNVHVVLAEAPLSAESTHSNHDSLQLTLSARTPDALQHLAARYAQYLNDHPEISAHDICLTANQGRARLRHTTTLAAADRTELQNALESLAHGDTPPSAGPTPLANSGRRLHGLPNYPFQRKRHWLHDWPAPNAVDSKPQPHTTQQQPPIQIATPACDELELRLIKIWESILPARPITTDQSFFDLGGTSVMALKLFDQLEREFKCALPLAELYSAPTIKDLANLLRQPTSQRRWEPLVLLNPTGSKHPLFFVPGLGGHAFDLRTMATRLGTDQPVYVLHPQGLDPQQAALTRIEEMAAAFIRCIKSVQPAGPYCLGGYSFGGSVAFEMARQLEQAGDEVALVAMLDAYAPKAFVKKSVPRRLFTHLHHMWGLNPTTRRDYFRQRVSRLLQRFNPAPREIKPQPGSVVDSVQRITDANQQAWRAYRPGVYNGRLLLFRASPREETIRIFCDADPTNGWSDHARRGVDVVALPCDHLAIFEGPALDLLTARLTSSLASINPNPSPVRRAS